MASLLCTTRSCKRIRCWWRAIDLNSTSLGIAAIMERQAPAAFMLRRADPGAQQVSSRLWWQRIRKGGTRMECLAARYELDVADLTVVLKSMSLAGFLEDLHSHNLLVRQGRDDSLVAEACEGLDKIRVPSWYSG